MKLIFRTLASLETQIIRVIGQPFLGELAINLPEEEDGVIFKPEYEFMDKEEILYPELYDMRRQAEAIINAIERVLPEYYHSVFLKMNRITASKRENMYPLTQLRSKMKSRNYALQFMTNGEFDPSKPYSKTQHAMMNEYQEVSKAYSQDKKKWLEKESTENVLIGYLNDNRPQIPQMIMFLLQGIYEEFEKAVNNTTEDDHLNNVKDQKDAVIQKFF